MGHATPLCVPLSSPNTSQFSPGDVVILGELHGSNESPDFLRKLICEELREGRHVVVGLEADTSLEGIVQSVDKESLSMALRELEVHPFWNRPADAQDGRSSFAMWSLWNELIMRSVTDSNLTIQPVQPSLRHKSIETFVDFLTKRSNSVGVILAGNMHTRLGFAKDLPENINFFAAKTHVRLNVVSLMMAYSGGSVWRCGNPCGVGDVGMPDLGIVDVGAYLFNESPLGVDAGRLKALLPLAKLFSGIYWLDKVTPSFPFSPSLLK